MSREIYESLPESKFEDFRVGDRIIDNDGDFGVIRRSGNPNYLIQFEEGTRGTNWLNHYGDRYDISGLEDTEYYSHLSCQVIKLYHKKVKSTPISRAFYRGKIKEEIDGILTIKL